MANEPTKAEMNKSIAEFMGSKDTGDGFVEIQGRKYSLSSRNYPHTLRYNLYWDWLMPVVDKIEQYAHVRIQVGICAITYRYMEMRKVAKKQGIPSNEVLPIAEHNEYDFIGNVFHAVYDFITWYNQQKQKDGTE